jgi:hypothetical protein
MENQIALVSKADKRVLNVLVVDNLDKDYIAQFATDECDVVAVKNATPHINGLWDGKKFEPPTNDYLKSIGLISKIEQPIDVDEKQAILDRIGLTADELKTILG